MNVAYLHCILYNVSALCHMTFTFEGSRILFQSSCFLSFLLPLSLHCKLNFCKLYTSTNWHIAFVNDCEGAGKDTLPATLYLHDCLHLPSAQKLQTGIQICTNCHHSSDNCNNSRAMKSSNKEKIPTLVHALLLSINCNNVAWMFPPQRDK